MARCSKEIGEYWTCSQRPGSSPRARINSGWWTRVLDTCLGRIEVFRCRRFVFCLIWTVEMIGRVSWICWEAFDGHMLYAGQARRAVKGQKRDVPGEAR